MELLFATSNPHKVYEVAQVLGSFGVRVLDLASLPLNTVEPAEVGVTFAENARLKARSYAAQTGRRCLAEDSGLEVDALAGNPGVFSARYAGVGNTPAERDLRNNQKLLRELCKVPTPERRARFVCAMCVAEPGGGIVAETRGICAGMIAWEPRGENGFGYDPLFLVPEAGGEPVAMAELTSEEKGRYSHRGAAVRALATALTGRS